MPAEPPEETTIGKRQQSKGSSGTKAQQAVSTAGKMTAITANKPIPVSQGYEQYFIDYYELCGV